MLLSAIKRSALYYKAFLNAFPHLSIFVQLKSRYFEFRYPDINTLSADFLMFDNKVVLIVEPDGI